MPEPDPPTSSNHKPASAGQRLLAAALLFSIAQLLSRILGFARDAYIAAAFGATGATDAFYAAFTIPDVLMYLVAGGTLSSTFLPMYSAHLSRGDSQRADRLYSVIATTMGVILAAGTIVLELFTPAIAARYLHHLRPSDLAIAIHLTRILLPIQLFFYLGSLSAATLQARDRNRALAIAPLIYNVATIAGGALLGRWLGVESLAWGSLAGAALGPFALQTWTARSAGLGFTPRVSLRDPEFVQWFKLSLPLMIGVTLVTADDWIIRYFAAADLGAISCVSYARKLVSVPTAVASSAIGLAAIAQFSRVHNEETPERFADLVSRTARGSATAAALAGAGLVALAHPLVDLLFRRGQFTAQQVEVTAHYLVLFAIAIPLWGMQGILARAFHAARDTLTPMSAGTVVTLVSIPVYALLFRTASVSGLVIASALGIFMHTAAVLVLLARKLPAFRVLPLIAGVARGIALSALAAFSASLAVRYLPTLTQARIADDLLRITAGSAVFLCVALVFAGPLGVEDVALVVRTLRRGRRSDERSAMRVHDGREGRE